MPYFATANFNSILPFTGEYKIVSAKCVETNVLALLSMDCSKPELAFITLDSLPNATPRVVAEFIVESGVYAYAFAFENYQVDTCDVKTSINAVEGKTLSIAENSYKGIPCKNPNSYLSSTRTLSLTHISNKKFLLELSNTSIQTLMGDTYTRSSVELLMEKIK